MDKELKIQSVLASVQFILARKNELSPLQHTGLTTVRTTSGPTAGGDIYLDGIRHGKVQPGDLVAGTNVTKERIEDQLAIVPGYDQETMHLRFLTGDLLWEARELWAEHRPERPSNYYIIMTRKAGGRPAINEEDRRIKLSISVAPRTATALDRLRGNTSRGAVIDCLLKYESLARAVAGIAKKQDKKK